MKGKSHLRLVVSFLHVINVHKVTSGTSLQCYVNIRRQYIVWYDLAVKPKWLTDIVLKAPLWNPREVTKRLKTRLYVDIYLAHMTYIEVDFNTR